MNQQGPEQSRSILAGRLVTRLAPFVLALAWGAQLLAALSWHHHNNTIINHEAHRLCLQFAQSVRDSGVGGALHFFSLKTYYPCGYPALAGMLTLELGSKGHPFLILNFIFLALTLVAIYGLGRNLSGVFVGFASSILFLTTPSIYMNARIPSEEIALASLAALSIYALVRSVEFINFRFSMLFALAFGFGMMIKWSFLLYLAVPFGAVLVLFIKKGLSGSHKMDSFQLTKTQWRNLVLVTGTIGLLAGPWYLGVLDRQILIRSSIYDGPANFQLWDVITYYMRSGSQLSVTWFLLPILLGLAVIGVFHCDSRRMWLVFVWLISGYMLLVIIPHKETRYFFPLIPAVCLLVALGVDWFNRTWVRVVFLLLIFSIGTIQFANLSFSKRVIPTGEGGWLPIESPSCFNAGESEINEFLALVDNLVCKRDFKKNLRVATYPFGYTMSWDLLRYQIEWSNFQKQRQRMDLVGFDGLQFHLIFSHLDELDVILVSANILEGNIGFLEKSLENWRASEYTPTVLANKFEPPKQDRFLLEKIRKDFEPIGTIGPPCYKPIDVMVRRGVDFGCFSSEPE